MGLRDTFRNLFKKKVTKTKDTVKTEQKPVTKKKQVKKKKSSKKAVKKSKGKKKSATKKKPVKKSRKKTETTDRKPLMYYMWKSTKKDPSLAKSKITPLFDKLFNTVEGYELLTFNGYALHAGHRLNEVPEDTVQVFFTDKKGHGFAVTLSKEKGFRVHYDYSGTLNDYISFLEAVIIGIEKAKEIMSEKNLKPQTDGKAWWNLLKSIMIQHEKEGKELVGVGMLNVPLKRD